MHVPLVQSGLRSTNYEAVVDNIRQIAVWSTSIDLSSFTSRKRHTMAAITPAYPVETATQEQHLEMAKISLANAYKHANVTDIVDSVFWREVAGLHSFLAGPS